MEFRGSAPTISRVWTVTAIHTSFVSEPNGRENTTSIGNAAEGRERTAVAHSLLPRSFPSSIGLLIAHHSAITDRSSAAVSPPFPISRMSRSAKKPGAENCANRAVSSGRRRRRQVAGVGILPRSSEQTATAARCRSPGRCAPAPRRPHRPECGASTASCPAHLQRSAGGSRCCAHANPAGGVSVQPLEKSVGKVAAKWARD